MAGTTKDDDVELRCHNCGGTTKKSMEWVADHDQYTCECGTLIPVDASTYRKEFAKTESASDGFRGLLEKLGK